MAKSKNTLPVKWEEELAKEAVAEAARATAAGGGNFVGTKGGVFQFQGEILGKEMEVIVVEFVHGKSWNPHQYDPENPQPPGCAALSVDGSEMAPFDQSPDKQSEACEDCPMNEWGSGVGRGKACADKRLLALIHAESEDFEEAPIVGLSLPPTAIKSWDSYVSNLAQVRKRPFRSVVTRFTMTPKGTVTIPIPSHSSDLDQKTYMALKKRFDEAREFLLAPPNFSGYVSPEQVSKRGGRGRAPAPVKGRGAKSAFSRGR